MTNHRNASGVAVATSCAIGVAAAALLLRQRKKKASHTSGYHHDDRKQYRIPLELQSGPYSDELQLAVKLALEAGSNMVPHCDTKGTIHEHVNSEETLGINTKTSAEDFCTKVDIENENLVIKGIQQRFPSHEIIGEESTGTKQVASLTQEPTWIIDPIDGTTNFASGLPLTCVSIGFCDKGRPMMGVVYAPMTNELYLTIRGYGAYRNGVKLSISGNKKKRLKDAVVDFEFGYARNKDDIAKMVGAVQRIMEHGCRTTRSLGSGVLDLCYVATGRIDVVYSGVTTEGWKPWDYCAGMLIVLESGGCIDSLEGCGGNEFDIYSSSVICAVNQDLLQECRAIVCSP